MTPAEKRSRFVEDNIDEIIDFDEVMKIEGVGRGVMTLTVHGELVGHASDPLVDLCKFGLCYDVTDEPVRLLNGAHRLQDFPAVRAPGVAAALLDHPEGLRILCLGFGGATLVVLSKSELPQLWHEQWTATRVDAPEEPAAHAHAPLGAFAATEHAPSRRGARGSPPRRRGRTR